MHKTLGNMQIAQLGIMQTPAIQQNCVGKLTDALDANRSVKHNANTSNIGEMGGGTYRRPQCCPRPQ